MDLPAFVDLSKLTPNLPPTQFSDLWAETMGNTSDQLDQLESDLGNLSAMTASAFPVSDPTEADFADAQAAFNTVDDSSVGAIATQLAPASAAVDAALADTTATLGAGDAGFTPAPVTPPPAAPAPTQPAPSGATPFRTDVFTDPALFSFNEALIGPADLVEIVHYTELPHYAAFGLGNNEINVTLLSAQPNPIWAGTFAEVVNGVYHTGVLVHFDKSAAPGSYTMLIQVDYVAGTPSDFLQVTVNWGQ